jgi:hypothetical protein
MLSRDGGETWTLADGSALNLPVTRDQTDLLVEHSDDLDVRASNPVCDDQSRPYYLTSQYRPENDLLLWYWREDGWQSKSLRHAIAEIVDFAPRFVQGVTCSFSEGRLYLAVVSSDRPSWNEVENEVYLLTSDDYGETFAAQQISETDPDLPNWGPSLERPVGHNEFGLPSLIWMHGDRGTGVADETTTEVIFGVLGED